MSKLVGYAYNAAIHCLDCSLQYVAAKGQTLPEGYPFLSDIHTTGYPKDEEGNPLSPYFDDEESDQPEHCDDCHKLVAFCLTGDGIEYVVRALNSYTTGRDKTDGNVLDEWAGHMESFYRYPNVERIVVAYRAVREWEKDQ